MASGTSALDAACATLTESITNFQSIQATPANGGFRTQVFEQALKNGVCLCPSYFDSDLTTFSQANLVSFKAALARRPATRDQLYTIRDTSRTLPKEVPGYVPSQHFREEIVNMLQYLEVTRDARAAAKEAKRAAQEKEAEDDKGKEKPKRTKPKKVRHTATFPSYFLTMFSPRASNLQPLW
jgi:hypothetical protein